ncbi:MAG: carboxypeptidase regulatory-like domain-containing protein, partial [Methanosarcinales archaeon]|nr:carboxypeptidase regulatory-like domain-containing protein [Methanosarcinales archaeon]
CADCHYASNLDDAPFNAAGGGCHTASACSTGGCHAGGATMVDTVHSVGVVDWGIKPSITVPSLDASSVAQGTDVTVTATVTAGGLRDYVDGAQYRIMDGAIEVLSWTAMTASDGNFEGSSDAATATLSTVALSGTYTIEVRGMGGGLAQNASAKYYPMNGDVSATQTTSLTVEPPMGYINGTVTSGGSPLAGAIVSTTGTSTTTAADGTYLLSVVAGTYDVTASKAPEYNDDTTIGVVVTSNSSTMQNFVLTLKSTGTITGNVTGL